MLIFLGLSQSKWPELDDRMSHAVGWAAASLLILFLGGIFVLIYEDSVQKAWQNVAFDFADQKITRFREGWPPIELLLTEINFLGESPSGLIVRGGEPSKALFIPRAISDFEELKRQLSGYCQVTPIKSRRALLSLIPLVLAIVVYLILFTSKNGAVVLIAGITALLFQGWAIFSMRKIWAKTSSPRAVMVAFLGSWLVLAWLVYQRVSSTL